MASQPLLCVPWLYILMHPVPSMPGPMMVEFSRALIAEKVGVQYKMALPILLFMSWLSIHRTQMWSMQYKVEARSLSKKHAELGFNKHRQKTVLV